MGFNVTASLMRYFNTIPNINPNTNLNPNKPIKPNSRFPDGSTLLQPTTSGSIFCNVA